MLPNGPEDAELVALMVNKANSMPQFRGKNIAQHGSWHGYSTQVCVDGDKVTLALGKLLTFVPSNNRSCARRGTRNLHLPALPAARLTCKAVNAAVCGMSAFHLAVKSVVIKQQQN